MRRFFFILFVCSSVHFMAASAVFAQASTAESGDGESALKLTGSYFTRYELRRGYPQTDSVEPGSDLVSYRARFGVLTPTMSVSDSVTIVAHFVPQSSGLMHVGGDTLVDAELGLHEGFAELGGEGFGFDLGRFEMSYGDDLVIGNVGWHPTGRAFDGLRVRLSPFESGAALDVFATVLAEGFVSGNGAPFAAGDLYFLGLYGKIGPALGVQGLELDAYLLSRVWGPVDVPNPADPLAEDAVFDRAGAADFTAGLRSKGKLGHFVYRVEGGLQFGQRPSSLAPVGETIPSRGVIAYQGDAEVGLDYLSDGPIKATLEGFYASGDDPQTEEDEGYNQLYPTAHKFLGLMDFAGARSNIYGAALHLTSALERFTFSLDVHQFFRPRAPEGSDSTLGTEADLGVVWTLGTGVKLRAVYGEFFPTAETLDDILHYGELELLVTY